MTTTQILQDQVVGSINSRADLKKTTKVDFGAQSTHPKVGTRKKRPGKVKVTGVVLTISPTECRSVYNNMVLGPCTQHALFSRVRK